MSGDGWKVAKATLDKDGQAMTLPAVTVAQSASLSDNFPADGPVITCQPD